MWPRPAVALEIVAGLIPIVVTGGVGTGLSRQYVSFACAD